jgi:hypothetical protein
LIHALEKRLKLTERAEKVKSGKKTARKPKRGRSSTYQELSYILIWLYRRNLMFPKIAELEDKWKYLDLHDPRFEHGLGIAAIAQYYAGTRTPDTQWLVEKSLSALSASLGEYQRTLVKTRSEVVSWLLRKNIVAVYNSLSDACILLYELDNRKAHIERGRKYIAKMNDYMEDNPIYFEGLPVPNMTEAQIEVCESEIALAKGDVFVARKKLEQAKKHYKKAKEKSSLMDPLFGQKVDIKIGELNKKFGIID